MSLPEALGSWRAEVRLSARRLLRRPARSAATVLVHALGIGAAVALFGLWSTLFLRPLPYPGADRLVSLLVTHGPGTGTAAEYSASPLDYVAWRERARSFEEVGATVPREIGLSGDDEPVSVRGESVSASLLRLLGADPLLGRTFGEDEDRRQAPVALLGHGLWTRRFASDPAVVGRTIRVDGMPHEVIGVLRPGFTTLFQRSDLYVPLGIHAGNLPRKGARYVATSARLRPGVSMESALAEMEAIRAALTAESPDTHTGWGLRIKPMREQYFGPRRGALALLLAGVGTLLVIGCANLAHLSLADALARRGEMALRVALGAGRARLLRGLAVESLLLALLGGAIGLAIALLLTPRVVAMDADLARLLGTPRFDPRVAAFAVVVSLVVGLLSGVLPALGRVRDAAPAAGSRRVTGDRRDRALRLTLLAGEVALSLVLLAGGALLVKGLADLRRTDPGFEPGGLLAAQVVLPPSRYSEAAARTAVVDRVLESLRGAPGVVSASTGMTRFAGASSMQVMVQVEGHTSERGDPDSAHFRRVSPGYLRTTGARLLAGREFEPADREGAPLVAVVSRSFARRYWPGQDAIGRRLKRGTAAKEWTTVVGVVADTRDAGLAFDASATLYVPHAQNSTAGMAFAPVTLLVRTSGDPMLAAPLLRRALQTADPELPMETPVRVTEALAASLGPQRFQAILLAGFATAGLLLAAAGLYGVTVHAVAQKTREIGVRMALGARSADVLRAVAGPALGAVAIGLLVGAAAARAGASLMARVIAGSGGWDPVLLAAAAAVLAAVAVAATLVPAWRGVRLDPAVALRED
jgi:predicted permease